MYWWWAGNCAGNWERDMSYYGNHTNLKGKVALVTGGSRGIGRAIALRLAEHGADVVINYQSAKEDAADVTRLINQIRTLEDIEELSLVVDKMITSDDAKAVSQLVESMGCHAYFIQADVSDIEQVNRMHDEIMQKFGKIDILVNNAGITRDKSFIKMTSQMWSDVIDVNLTGAFNCTKAVISGMVARKYGKIINISSVIGRMGSFGQANYAAAKAGLIGLTQTLAKEFADKGITVNAIAPGFIETEMVKGIPRDIMEKIIAKIPVGRFGKPSDVAGAVAYLTSEDGNYITGQVIDLNGGLYI